MVATPWPTPSHDGSLAAAPNVAPARPELTQEAHLPIVVAAKHHLAPIDECIGLSRLSDQESGLLLRPAQDPYVVGWC